MSADRARRTVLITGASSGIGRATAAAFAGDGAHVIGVARDAARLSAVARELGIEALPADVADAASMDALVRTLDARGVVPDVIVANAGIGLDARFVETTDAALQRVLEVNVVGVVRTIRPFVTAMVRRGSGRIIIVSSIVGKRGIPHYAAYAASKFALHGLADALRVELHGTGVSVGLICPASTRTEFQERMQRIGPTQRFVRPRRHDPENVAAAILRLARSRRAEMLPALESKLMVAADCLAPRLVDAVLARVLGRKEKSGV